MTYPVLNQYLSRLSERGSGATSIWLDADGKAVGRFFNCTMSSAFQPVRALGGDGAVHAYEGLARSVDSADQGLSLWRLLDHAASDDESVELDRLCRMLHAINFFRQSGEADGGSADLYLNVHDRLLSAVSSNHGYAFQRILAALDLPIARIVLQLPQITAQQGWLLNYVADNYRRNGFRFAVHVSDAAEGQALLQRVRPDVIKFDARTLGQHGDGDAAAATEAAIAALLRHSRDAGTTVVFKRVEAAHTLAALERIGAAAGSVPLAQGFVLDRPHALLAPLRAPQQAAA